MIHSTWEDKDRNQIHQQQQLNFEDPNYDENYDKNQDENQDENHPEFLSTIGNASKLYWQDFGEPELPSPTVLLLEKLERRCGQYTKEKRPTAAQIAREANNHMFTVMNVFGVDAALIGPQLKNGKLLTRKDSFTKGRVHKILRRRKTGIVKKAAQRSSAVRQSTGA